MPFQGTFVDNCIEDAMPSLHEQLASKPDLAMAQLLKYNSYAKCREEAKDHENPFPISIGMFNLLKKIRLKYCFMVTIIYM